MKTTGTKTSCLRVITILILLVLPFIGFSQANNLICGATTLASAPVGSCSPTAGSITAATTYTAVATACGTANNRDVWYTFTARSTNPTITLSPVSLTQSSIALYTVTGTCPALVAVTTPFCGTSITSLTASGLTIGNTYYIRIFSNSNNTGTFSICVTDPAPANNLCANSILLTSATTCVNTAGNMQASTMTALAAFAASPANCEAGTVVYDVWYRFVAQTTNPTITLSNIGAGFAANAKMQLITWSGTVCTTTPTAFYCGTTSIAANYLTIGTTYYIRVYSTAGTSPANGLDMDFDICVTDPVIPAPFNNECANATNLPISSACDNFPGSMAGATLSTAPAPSCGTPTYDVWYKFTAVNNSTDITLSSMGTNFTNAFIQVLSGSCGSLTQVACGTSITNYVSTPGTTYYVRVFSTTAGAAPNGNANFNICVRGNNAPIRFGNSYVNISKKTNGGVVQTGDTLEIRMTINHKSGTLYNARYMDSIPIGTVMLTGTADSIRIITNEGLTYKKYTLAAGDDGGTYLASPSSGQYHVRLNLALGGYATGVPAAGNTNEAASSLGQVLSTHNPRGGGGVLFAIAYRVRVTAPTGGVVMLNRGKFMYRTAPGANDSTLTATPFQIQVSNVQTLCSNSVGLNNALEDGGTFGNGTTLARTTDLSSPITGYSYIPNPSNIVAIGDGRYSIVKNVSPRNSTNRTARQVPNCSNPSALVFDDPNSCYNRMYDHWVIDGDHTGTSNAVGNVPPAVNSNGGYMLLVNADFIASEAYRQTISNLCPNTYYEFSAWIRNVCSTCGADSLGQQFTNSAEVSRHAGVVGVYPNLSFAVDGVDRYSTGEVDVTGWEKRGFVFQTGPSQTSATFTIRNNSQGGGGNDWAMDDISVSTCIPTMRYSPTTADSLCMNNPYTIGDTVRSAYNTYTQYKWQRKRSYESSWTDLTGILTGTPAWNGTQYQYVASYFLPPSETTYANNGDLYRVVVATTSANLSNNDCTYTDSTAIFNLRVMDCFDVLSVKLLSFNGRIANRRAGLTWITSQEKTSVRFELEKSNDGRSFYKIADIGGQNNPGAGTNRYSFTDSSVLSEKAYYRLQMIPYSGSKTSSQIITLQSGADEFSVNNLVNPFNSSLRFEVVVGDASTTEVQLLDGTGRSVIKKPVLTYPGSNAVVLGEVANLIPGVYILQVAHKGKTISHKIIKK